MQHRSESSRKDSSNSNQITPAELAHAAGPQYVEVAVPVHVSATFIYRLPAALRHQAQPGSRIVVSFGRKFVTGYIVALLENLPSATSLQETDIKEAKEVLDAIPLLTPELLQLTRWVAEYYLAPPGEVIKAALPPGISPTLAPFLSITNEGRGELEKDCARDTAPIRQRLLAFVGQSDEVSLAT
ncbi:MAG: hypothetical protein LC775_02820, partial [Acidobacteria bacterium]|nr:hypothetical protein [Acidobacteriota bacterium]